MRFKFFIFSVLLTIASHQLIAQKAAIEVADLSIKVPGLGTQEYFYGFEEGDELNFTYEYSNKKGIKQIEIIEYPNNVKYSGYEVNNISKSIKITKRGIYIFRFNNTALGQRVGSVKIMRTPESDLKVNFNTNVLWKEIADTTYTAITSKELVGYDTVFTYATKKQLIHQDTIPIEVISKKEQISAYTTIGKPSESTLMITLPQNRQTSLESVELISWAYWIGVGQEGHQAFEKNKASYMKALAGVANATGNPLIGFALNKFAFLPTGNSGSNVAYYFMTDETNARIFQNSYDKGGFRYFDAGNGVSGFGRREAPLQGTFFIGFHNDNYHNEINVEVKVVAIMVRKLFEENKVRQASIVPRYENKIIKQPSVNFRKVPSLSNIDL